MEEYFCKEMRVRETLGDPSMSILEQGSIGPLMSHFKKYDVGAVM
jgi:hypothetical protein